MLIGYPDEVAKAIAFVFSDMLICDDAASAQAVMFAHEVGVHSITLDGDVYELSRTMLGGVALSGSGVLVCVQELCTVEEHVTAVWRVLVELEREEITCCVAKDKWKERTHELEQMLTHGPFNSWGYNMWRTSVWARISSSTVASRSA